MSDAFTDAADTARTEYRKNLPLDERIRMARRDYYDAVRNFLYCPAVRTKLRSAAKVVVLKKAKIWDELADGDTAREVPSVLNKLASRDEQAWADLLCETADCTGIFDDLANLSPFCAQGDIMIICTNGDSVMAVQGRFKKLIQSQIPNNAQAMSRHLFVTNRSVLINRIGR